MYDELTIIPEIFVTIGSDELRIIAVFCYKFLNITVMDSAGNF